MPFLPFDRAIETAKALPFRPGVLQKYLRDNARRVFKWGDRGAVMKALDAQ